MGTLKSLASNLKLSPLLKLPATYFTRIAEKLSSTSPSVDGSDGKGRIRASRYNELYVLPSISKKYPTVTGGEYYTVTRDPGSTFTIGGGTTFAYSATQAVAVLKNNAPTGSNVRCYVDYYRLTILNVFPQLSLATSIDSGNRSPITLLAEGAAGSAGAAYAPAIKSPNMDSPISPYGTVFFPLTSVTGNMGFTIASPSPAARRLVGRIPFRTVAPVGTSTGQAEVYHVDFGGEITGCSLKIAEGASSGASNYTSYHPGVVIGPQQYLIIHAYTAAAQPSSLWTMDFGWWER